MPPVLRRPALVPVVLALALAGCRTVPVGSRRGGPAPEDGLVIEASRLRPAPPPLSTYPGELAAPDDTLSSGEWVDWYDVYALEGQTLTVEMTSTSELDPYVMVILPTGEQEENDDAAPGDLRHARVVVRVPVEGPFRVGATSFMPGEAGGYKLSVSVR